MKFQQFQYDGININYTVEGTGPDVLLLHGWGASIASVRPIINILKGSFRVTALDMPGCGESGEPARPYDLGDYAELVVCLAKALAIENPIVIGHSNGGLVALYLNIEKKLKIKKNVLIDSTGAPRVRTFKTSIKIRMFKTARTVLSFPLWKKAGAPIIEKARDRIGSEDYKNASPVMKKTMINLLRHDLSPGMPGISVPTLIIWGELDKATPLCMGRHIESLIPDSGLVVLKGAGHFSYLDRPVDFEIILKNFLEAVK